MDSEPTTIRVIAPNDRYLNEVLPVSATNGEYAYADIGGKTLCYHKDQVEVVHVQDFDQFMAITGQINRHTWQAIKTFAESLPGFVLLSGWTGDNGSMSLKFDLGCASKYLQAVSQFASQFDVVVSKYERQLFYG